MSRSKFSEKSTTRSAPTATKKQASVTTRSSLSSIRSPTNLQAKVAEAGISGIQGVAASAAAVDAEHQRANAESTAAFQDVLKEGIKKAETPEERMQFAKMSESGDKRQKEASEQSASRGAETQRGAIRYIGFIVGALLGALSGGLAYSAIKKDE